MSVNSQCALPLILTFYFDAYFLNNFLPHLTGCLNLLLAVSRLSNEVREAGYAFVDHRLLERLNYILCEVLLDAKK